MPLTRVTSNVIQDGTIIDADIKADAGINPSKLGAGTLPVGTTVNPSQLNAGALPSSITTLATGSTTARSLANRFAEKFNVKDWGLVGDGVTDDAPALRTLMAHVNTLNKAVVYFPQGNYNLGTFTDGTSTFVIPPGGNQAGKSCVFIKNNFNNPVKSIVFIGENATIESPLYCQTKNIYPNAGYVFFFAIEGAYNLLVEGIEFKRKVGGVGQQPLMAEDYTGQTSNNGASYAFSIIAVNQFNNGDPWGTAKSENISITNCKFVDFSVPINIWSAKYVIVDKCKFNSTWGVCSSGGTNIDFTASVCTRSGVDFVSATNNEFIGGPEDYTPILNIASGNNVIFRPAENALFNIGAKKSNICNNFANRYAYEILVSGRQSNNDAKENIHVVNDNTIWGDPGIGANWKNYSKSGNDGIVINGPNATVVGNNIAECGKSIWFAGGSNSFDLGGSNSLISNNVIKITTNPIFKGGGGIDIAFGGISNEVTQVIRISNNIITADQIQPYVLSDGNPPNWNGNVGTYTSGPFFAYTPCAISLGGSGLHRTIINDNTLTLKSKANPNLYYAAIVSDCQMELINNRIDGWDFAFLKNGGNFSKFTSRGLTTNNIKRLFASPSNRGSEAVCNFDYSLEFIPFETGWYRLYNYVRYSGLIELYIQTNNESWYGDSTQNASNFYLQNTKLALSLAGIENSPSKVVQIVQYSHIQSEFCPITKLYYIPSTNGLQSQELYAYVDKTTLRVQLNFSGGGGSGANGYGVVTNGVITSVVMTNNGTNYTSAPTIIVARQIGTREFDFNPVFGSGAVFTANLSSGTIQSVTVNNGGSGYSQPIYIKSIIQNYSNQSPFVFEIEKVSTTPSGGLEFNFSTGTKAISYFGSVPGGPRKYGTGYPLLGTAAPTTTPEFIGQEFIDTTNQIVYRATGTASSANWKALN